MCRYCKGSGALWNRSIGTWEPCGCDEVEVEDGPDPDDERDRRADEALMDRDWED